MRISALAIIGLLGLGAHSLKAQTNIYNRDITSLDGEWHYLIDVQEEGYYDYRMNPSPWGFFLNAKPKQPQDLIEYSFDSVPTMHIPGDWYMQK